MHRRVPRILRCVLLLFPVLFFGNRATFAVDCPLCKQPYPDFTWLAFHGALEHKLWLCPKCTETFSVKDRKLYWYHRIKEHGEAVCFDCNLRAFRDRREWERHRKQHEKDISFFSLNSIPCCSRAPAKFGSHWVRKLHIAHFHGSWLDFFATVRVLSDCCESFRGAILTDYSDYLKDDLEDNVRKKFLKGIRNFSKHVYHKHDLCFLCEREIDKDIFDNHPHLGADVFLQLRGNVSNCTCLCGNEVQRNAESRLFALKIDRLPFGTGLDTVTHPFCCIVDGNKAERKAPLKDVKTENAVLWKFGEKSGNYSNKSKGLFRALSSPSLFRKSVDTTLTSTDDKNYEGCLKLDARTFHLTDNETDEKFFENL